MDTPNYITQCESYIEELRACKAEQDTLIAGFNAAIALKDARIAELQARIDELGQIGTSNVYLSKG